MIIQCKACYQKDVEPQSKSIESPVITPGRVSCNLRQNVHCAYEERSDLVDFH